MPLRDFFFYTLVFFMSLSLHRSFFCTTAEDTKPGDHLFDGDVEIKMRLCSIAEGTKLDDHLFYGGVEIN